MDANTKLKGEYIWDNILRELDDGSEESSTGFISYQNFEDAMMTIQL